MNYIRTLILDLRSQISHFFISNNKYINFIDEIKKVEKIGCYEKTVSTSIKKNLSDNDFEKEIKLFLINSEIDILNDIFNIKNNVNSIYPVYYGTNVNNLYQIGKIDNVSTENKIITMYQSCCCCDVYYILQIDNFSETISISLTLNCKVL